MSRKTARKKKRLIVEDSWSIDHAFVKWIVPRLDLLIDRDFGHPTSLTSEEWINILKTMREGFSYYQTVGCLPSKDEVAKTDESLDLFKKYFYDLWD